MNKNIEVHLSSKAENILSQIDSNTKFGDLRKIAKEIKKIMNWRWSYGQQNSFCQDY